MPTDSAWGTQGISVTADGRVVVGRLFLAYDRLDRRGDFAGIWTAEAGHMRPLQDLLVSHYGLGPNLAGYHLTGIYDVTDDGRFMVGHMIGPDWQQGDVITGEAFLVDLGLRGDFNGDETLSIHDLNALASAINAEQDDLTFELDYSYAVDLTDQQIWVRELKRTSFGDANLDGQFNSSDLVSVFQAGQYEDDLADNSTWATGDCNADGDFTTSDLVLAFQDGGYEQGPRGAFAAVPEPASCILG